MRAAQVFGNRWIVKIFLVVTAIAAALPLHAAVSQSPAGVQLSWEPSVSTNVVGYDFYYAAASDHFIRFVLGNVTHVTIHPVTGVTYHFKVTARDSNGNESVPSNVASYPLPVPTPPLPSLSVGVQASQMNGAANSVTIRTADIIPSGWMLEASQDLKAWRPLATGSNSTVNVAVWSADVPALFFRLKSQ